MVAAIAVAIAVLWPTAPQAVWKNCRGSAGREDHVMVAN